MKHGHRHKPSINDVTAKGEADQRFCKNIKLYISLFTKKRDIEGKRVKNWPKLFDVIYGRPPTSNIPTHHALHGRNVCLVLFRTLGAKKVE